jgi:DNA-binding MarR family transcriptional regulator
MSDNPSDLGLKALEQLSSSVFPKLAESDTRAKMIDPIFKECLGWKEEDIRRETSVHKGFVDYIFRTGKVLRFILEAKSEGESFEIPKSQASRYYKIRGAITTDPKIKAAIEQAQRYCAEAGSTHGVVSNGHQYIIFEAFKHGSDWRDGRCVIFRSLDDIKQNFTLFWNILGRESVVAGSLKKHVSQEESPLEFVVPRQELHASDSSLTRNDLGPILQAFIDYIFADLTDQSQLDVLKKCYVAQKQFGDANLQIGRQFDRPPAFAEKYQVHPVFESPVSAGSFQTYYEQCEKLLRSTSRRGYLTILMGGVGCGKTTFIHHFYNFVIGNRVDTVWFYVDFTKAPAEPKEIEDYIYKSVFQDFQNRYSGKYGKIKQELTDIGVHWGAPGVKDIVVLFSLLLRDGCTLSLVLDNADQYSYVSPEYQERVLLVARNLTESLKTITIITLREESFFKSTMSGVLDAFVAPVFHVSSPPFEGLIRYRIDYILELLKKPDSEIEAATGSSSNVGPKRDTLVIFFEIIKNSLRRSRAVGKEILEFIDEISGGDMRVALRFFRIFLTSGNTDVSEMLDIELRERRVGGTGYQLPFHHVIRSIILEDSRLYSNARSQIMNVFNVNPQYTNSHFIHLSILNYLHTRIAYDTLHGRGYVEIDRMINEAEELSINRGAISDSIKKMAACGLVQFENQSKDGYDRAVYVRITNMGTYYLRKLIYKFPYLDLVWMDTPISDPETVKYLLQCVVELVPYKTPQYLKDKFTRTEVFLNYLDKTEEMMFDNNPEFKHSNLTSTEFMPRILQCFQEEKGAILKKREKAANPRRG